MKIQRIIFLFAFALLFVHCEEPQVEGNFGKISGTLVNLEGDGSNILVELIEATNQKKASKKAANKVIAEIRTDENGRFTFKRLTPKNYIIKVYPHNAPSFQYRVSLETAENMQLDIDVQEQLRKSQPALKGRVLSKNEQQALEDITLKLFDSAEEIVAETSSDEQGNFSFEGLAQGNYALQTKDAIYKEDTSVFSLNESMQLVIELERKTGDVIGKIVDFPNSNYPAEDQQIELYQEQEKVDETKTDDAGEFAFQDIPYGDYRLKSEKNDKNIDQPFTLSHPQSYHELSFVEESPAVAVRGVRVNNATANSANFSVNLATMGTNQNKSQMKLQNGSVTAGNFSIENVSEQGVDFNFSGVINFSSTANANNYNYSAMLLIDQSGSISWTDPNHVRLLGSKMFLGNVTGNDEVGVAAFASGGDIQNSPYTLYENGFSNNPAIFYDDIDALENKVTGGTPLYESTIAMTDYVASNGSKTVKTVVVFTDGEDNGPASLDEAIDNASSKNIRLITIGLDDGTNRQVLSQMAQETDGYSIWAENTQQLASAFVDLDDLLRENTTNYSLDFELNISKNYFPGTLSFNMQFTYNGETVNVPITITVTADQLKKKATSRENNMRLYEKVYYPDN